MVSKDFAIIASIIIMFLLIIFMFIKIQKLSKNNIKENFSSGDLAKVRTEINKIYDMDVEAIRNLGHISKSLLTGTNYHSTDPGTPGDLTIPATNTKFKGDISVDGYIRKNNCTIWPNGDMTIGPSRFQNNGHITVGSGLDMHDWQPLRWLGRGHLVSTGESGHFVFTAKHGVLIYKDGDGNSSGNLTVGGNLTVQGDIIIGSTTIRPDGSITIGRTTIDKDGNITYGSIKPHPNNPETLLRMQGNGAHGNEHVDFREVCPEGKTMAGFNGRAWSDISRIQAVCR
jgi:hypothetical protein